MGKKEPKSSPFARALASGSIGLAAAHQKLASLKQFAAADRDHPDLPARSKMGMKPPYFLILYSVIVWQTKIRKVSKR
ncbi:MAG: hypothetical protein R2861_09055 [Desulfobacterales bacterium]